MREESSRPDLLVAERYALLNRLGVGGMGEVWQAHDLLTGQSVAVKILRASIAGAPAAELRFQREIKVMARLDHPRVVPLIDAGSDPVMGLFFVMTLQYGKPLHEIAATWNHWNPLWAVTDQILETLAYAHAHNVVHRDIKPDNIFVDGRNEAILLDFGVAQLRDQARSGTSAYDLLGTVDYAAPEQATGNRRRIGPWTDLYCFGIVLYEMICGRLPFWAPSPVQSLMIRLDRAAPPLQPRPGYVTPKGLSELLQRMTHPDPFQRFTHANDARRAFAATLKGPYELISPARPEHATPPPLSPRHSEHTDDEIEVLREQRRAHVDRSEASLDLASLEMRAMEPPLRPPKFVGRQRVMSQLRRGFENWMLQPAPGVLVLVGDQGVGKSRLAQELLVPYLADHRLDGHWHRWEPEHDMRVVALSIAGSIGLPRDAQREHMKWWLEGHGLKKEIHLTPLLNWLVEGTQREEARRYFAHFIKVTTGGRPFFLVLDALDRLDMGALAVVDALRAYRLPTLVLITSRSSQVSGGAPPKWLAAAIKRISALDEMSLNKILIDLALLNET
ncbi:serine/threonine-protein kinase PknK, partial [Myxococcota bacterium]|nr:serine/threonine-protein kinase PknK [Myxococcota bacterium]